MEEKSNTILKLISNRNYGTYNKSMARAYGIEVAIMLGELAGEYDYYYELDKVDDGWFYSTSENIEYNTSLTYYQQTKAINKLIELGVIEQKRAGIPAKRYFRFNTKKLEQVIKIIDKYFSKNLNSSFQKTSKLDVKKFEINNNKNNNKEKIINNNNNKKEDINIITTTTSNNIIYSGGGEISNNSDSNIYEYIEKNFGRPLSPIEYQKIDKWEDNELTRYAVEVAVLNNIHKISYIEGILRNFKDNDIHTVSEAKEFDKKLHKKRNIKTEFIPFVYRDNDLWVYKDENGKGMFCNKPYQGDDGEWKFKNGYGKEMKCSVNIDDFKEN